VQTNVSGYWSLRYGDIIQKVSQVFCSQEYPCNLTRHLSLPHDHTCQCCGRANLVFCVLLYDQNLKMTDLTTGSTCWLLSEWSSAKQLLTARTQWCHKWQNLHSSEYRPSLDQSDEGFETLHRHPQTTGLALLQPGDPTPPSEDMY